MVIQAYCGQAVGYCRGVVDRNPKVVKRVGICSVGLIAFGVFKVGSPEFTRQNPKFMLNAVPAAIGITAGIVGIGIVAGALFVTLRSLAGNETYESGVQWLREKTERHPNTTFLISTGAVITVAGAALKYTIGNMSMFARHNPDITIWGAGASLLAVTLVIGVWNNTRKERDSSLTFMVSGMRLLCWLNVAITSTSVVSVAAMTMRKEVIVKWVQQNPTLGCASLFLPLIALPAAPIALFCLVQKALQGNMIRAVNRA